MIRGIRKIVDSQKMENRQFVEIWQLGKKNLRKNHMYERASKFRSCFMDSAENSLDFSVAMGVLSKYTASVWIFYYILMSHVLLSFY